MKIDESLVNQMTSEINSKEMNAINDFESENPPKLEHFGKTDEERFETLSKKMDYRRTEIEEIVRQLANKFDISNSKTYEQIKEIVSLLLIQKKIYSQTYAETRQDNNSKKKVATDLFSEHRKYAELIVKLLGKVYVPEVKQKTNPVISRKELFETNRWIKIE